RVDSKNGGIRTTFAKAPDAPVTKFTLEMQGGKKSLLVNSRNLCLTNRRARVSLQAQSDRSRVSGARIATSCGKK
ncbi:MAG TPA: hypothetical protein VN732_04090, partial [Solirubrobacterales bacterium]|nr:hypothetical protein [Solirubrobacterales bacterium]